MNNIPTAEQWLSNHKDLSMYDVEAYDEGGYLGVDRRALYNIMTEFAKFHVEAALKAASEKAMLKVVNTEEFRDIEEGEDLVESYECGSDVIHISINSILNAYNINLIK